MNNNGQIQKKKTQNDSYASILIKSHDVDVSCCASFRVELQVLREIQLFEIIVAFDNYACNQGRLLF